MATQFHGSFGAGRSAFCFSGPSFPVSCSADAHLSFAVDQASASSGDSVVLSGSSHG